MKRFVARASLVALALSTSGCAMTFDATHLGVIATMAEPAQAPAPGQAFRITKHPLYLGWGLFQIGETNLDDLLAGQLGNGGSIAGLKIEVKSSPFSAIVTVLTVGLIAPRSITYEGVVVPK